MKIIISEPHEYFVPKTSYFVPPTSYLLLRISYFVPPTSYLLLRTSYFVLPTSYFLLRKKQSATISFASLRTAALLYLLLTAYRLITLRVITPSPSTICTIYTPLAIPVRSNVYPLLPAAFSRCDATCCP